MSDDQITVPGQSHDNAVLLLEAAQQLDLDPSVVRTTEGGFLVPKEVADKAGFDENGKPTGKAAKEAAKAAEENAAEPTDVRAQQAEQHAAAEQQAPKAAKKSGE
jgi:hypothetical protein